MTTATEGFKTELIGNWSDWTPFEVERERIAAYAAATNDPIAPHAAGDLAPPVFAIVPAFQALGMAIAGVTPPDLIMAILHGEQDFRYHGAIEPGMTLETRSAPIGIQPRSSGVTVVAKGETRDTASGAVLVDQYMTAFVRGGQAAEAVGEQPEGHSFDEALRERDPDADVTQRFDEDQTFRYSEASGDPMPIHLDDELAKKMGLPGIIIHGLCTMAFTSVAVIEHACPDDPSALKRLAVRFSKPVEPKQSITTRIWDGSSGTYAYETTADSGEVVIKDGLAEISA